MSHLPNGERCKLITYPLHNQCISSFDEYFKDLNHVIPTNLWTNINTYREPSVVKVLF